MRQQINTRDLLWRIILVALAALTVLVCLMPEHSSAARSGAGNMGSFIVRPGERGFDGQLDLGYLSRKNTPEMENFNCVAKGGRVITDDMQDALNDINKTATLIYFNQWNYDTAGWGGSKDIKEDTVGDLYDSPAYGLGNGTEGLRKFIAKEKQLLNRTYTNPSTGNSNYTVWSRYGNRRFENQNRSGAGDQNGFFQDAIGVFGDVSKWTGNAIGGTVKLGTLVAGEAVSLPGTVAREVGERVPGFPGKYLVWGGKVFQIKGNTIKLLGRINDKALSTAGNTVDAVTNGAKEYEWGDDFGDREAMFYLWAKTGDGEEDDIWVGLDVGGYADERNFRDQFPINRKQGQTLRWILNSKAQTPLDIVHANRVSQGCIQGSFGSSFNQKIGDFFDAPGLFVGELIVYSMSLLVEQAYNVVFPIAYRYTFYTPHTERGDLIWQVDANCLKSLRAQFGPVKTEYCKGNTPLGFSKKNLSPNADKPIYLVIAQMIAWLTTGLYLLILFASAIVFMYRGNRAQNLNLMRIWPRLLVSAILTITASYIIGGLITISNILVKSIFEMGNDSAMAAMNTLLSIAGYVMGFDSGIGISLGQFLTGLVVTIVSAIFAIGSLLRQLILIMLLILAPLAMFCLITDAWKPRFNHWWRALLAVVFVPVIMAAIVRIGMMINPIVYMASKGQLESGATGLAGILMILATLVAAAWVLVAALRAAISDKAAKQLGRQMGFSRAPRMPGLPGLPGSGSGGPSGAGSYQMIPAGRETVQAGDVAFAPAGGPVRGLPGPVAVDGEQGEQKESWGKRMVGWMEARQAKNKERPARTIATTDNSQNDIANTTNISNWIEGQQAAGALAGQIPGGGGGEESDHHHRSLSPQAGEEMKTKIAARKETLRRAQPEASEEQIAKNLDQYARQELGLVNHRSLFKDETTGNYSAVMLTKDGKQENDAEVGKQGLEKDVLPGVDSNIAPNS